MAAYLALLALAACGGGGGSGDAVSATAPPVAAAPSPTTGSAGSGDLTPAIAQSTTPNVQPIKVSALPTRVRNMLITSVTVCAPGTSNCATIDSIQVDTGSQGLRLLASALPATLALPAMPAAGGGAAGTSGTSGTGGTSGTSDSAGSGTGTGTSIGSGGISGECAVFGTGYTWGAVRSADVRLAGQVAASLPVQVIADPVLPAVPDDCARSGPSMMTPATLRVNGILGIGLFAVDCGSACASAARPRWYYACDASGACTPSSQPIEAQVANPVSRFATDNNGVVIDLPAIADTGVPQVEGSLIFGIGTQANNALAGTTVLKANAQTGYVTTVSNGQSWPLSFVDSGSNGMFFADPGLPQCGIWYCPSAQQTLTATLRGTDGATATVAFPVANAQTLLGSSNNAFHNLAGFSSTMFDWGLPFFFGRRVYTAIEARATPVGKGPFYAF
jgi:hypothetical protein